MVYVVGWVRVGYGTGETLLSHRLRATGKHEAGLLAQRTELLQDNRRCEAALDKATKR